MHKWLCGAKNRSGLRRFYHFLLQFAPSFSPSFFPRGAEGAEKGENPKRKKKTFMSEMIFSNPSYSVLICLLSKDESMLMQKKRIYYNSLHFTTFFSSVSDPGQLVSDSPPFLPSLKKSYLFLLVNKIDLIFFSCNKDEWW